MALPNIKDPDYVIRECIDPALNRIKLVFQHFKPHEQFDYIQCCEALLVYLSVLIQEKCISQNEKIETINIRQCRLCLQETIKKSVPFSLDFAFIIYSALNLNTAVLINACRKILQNDTLYPRENIIPIICTPQHTKKRPRQIS